MKRRRRPRPGAPLRRRAVGALERLETLRATFSPEAARERAELFERLAGSRLASAADLERLHELLLFARAIPDDARVAALAERLLSGFARRPDLRRRRRELEASGIEGTAIPYPFFYPTALWLARRFPGRLAIDWARFADPEEISPLIAALLAPHERAGPVEGEGPRAVLARLAGGRRTDAEELLERLAALPGDDFTREALHDATLPWYVLAPGAAGPSRTRGRAPASPLVFRARPFERARPDLAREWSRPPREVVELSPARARPLLDLAREAMATRARDLDAFAYGDPRDARRLRDDDGLEFVAFGSRPERRLPLSTVYGLLTLRNGVPAGYAQIDGFLSTALVHFNTFETFRGADAAWVFARLLAATRRLLGVSAVAIEPYQLGRGNPEAIDSGAWWFYAKLGFSPRDPEVESLARRERARFARDRRARSTPATLARLADRHLFWEPLGLRATVPPHAPIARAAIATLAGRGGSDLAAARRELAARAAALLGFGEGPRPDRAVSLWLERWAPMLLALPGFASWPTADRHAIAELLAAKAGRREADLLPLSRRHPRFGPALLELAGRGLAPGEEL